MSVDPISPVANSLVSDRIAVMLSNAHKKMQVSISNLASGSRLSNPSTDPAALAQALKLDAQINRTSAAETNLGNAESFSNVQNGNLETVGKALDRGARTRDLGGALTTSQMADAVIAAL